MLAWRSAGGVWLGGTGVGVGSGAHAAASMTTETVTSNMQTGSPREREKNDHSHASHGVGMPRMQGRTPVPRRVVASDTMARRSIAYESEMQRIANGGYRRARRRRRLRRWRVRGGSLGAWANLANAEIPDTRPRHPRRLHSSRRGRHQHQHVRLHGAESRRARDTRTRGGAEPRGGVDRAGGARARRGGAPAARGGLHDDDQLSRTGGQGCPRRGGLGARVAGTHTRGCGRGLPHVVEMLSHVERARVELAAAATAGLPVWAGFSCVADEEGNLTLMNQRGRAAGGVAAAHRPLRPRRWVHHAHPRPMRWSRRSPSCGPRLGRSARRVSSRWDVHASQLGVRRRLHAGRARGGARSAGWPTTAASLAAAAAATPAHITALRSGSWTRRHATG